MKRPIVQPFVVVTVLLLGCVTLAISYNAAEGLEEAVSAAFSAWQDLDETLELTDVNAEESNEVTFGYGEATAFGPDTLSVTVQRGDGTLDILINESKTETLERVLLHETGLALGLSSGVGIMNPSVSDNSAELGELERLALENVFNAVKEDINRDGVVDFYDLNALARAFGQTDLNNVADINGDDVVDEADLELLRAAYTFGPPSETEPASTETEFDDTLLEPETSEVDDPVLEPAEEATPDTPIEDAPTETEPDADSETTEPGNGDGSADETPAGTPEADEADPPSDDSDPGDSDADPADTDSNNNGEGSP